MRGSTVFCKKQDVHHCIWMCRSTSQEVEAFIIFYTNTFKALMRMPLQMRVASLVTRDSFFKMIVMQHSKALLHVTTLSRDAN